jgi:Rhs element Vgr protein
MPESRVIPTQASTDLPTFSILVNGEEISGEIGIENIYVTKGVNRIPTARIVLYDGSVSKETFEISDGDIFLPGSEIEILAGYHAVEDPVFKGIIIRQSIKTKGDQASQLILDLKDASIKMTVGRKNKYFEEVLDSDVIEELVSSYGLQSEVEATEVTYPHMVQYYATDWDFMVSRAEMNGQLVFVDDGKITVKKPDLSADPLLELAYGHNVFEFDAAMDARDQYAAVKTKAWDYTSQEVLEGEGEDPGFDLPGNISATDLAAVLGLEELPMHHSGRVKDAELKSWADAKMLRSRLAKIQGKVKIQGFSDIKPGHIVELAGFGDRFNGVVFVSSVAHRFANNSNWFTTIEFGLSQEWFMNKYDNIMEKPASGLLPAIHGLQIGVVTNIHEDPDGEERIKVRIPVIDSENEGVWARLATLDAGENRGIVFRPEVGDEVIVGFLNDDPRDPIILGSLHSSAKPAPITADEENKEKGLVTKNGMRMVFDDDLVSITIETPNGNSIVISEDEGGIFIKDENDNKIELTSDGINIETAGDLNLKASGDVNIEGVNISLAAQSQFKAEGSSGAEVSTSGQAVLKGSVVMIN